MGWSLTNVDIIATKTWWAYHGVVDDDDDYDDNDACRKHAGDQLHLCFRSVNRSKEWFSQHTGTYSHPGSPPPKKLLRSKAAGYSLGEIGENHTDKKLSSLYRYDKLCSFFQKTDGKNKLYTCRSYQTSILHVETSYQNTGHSSSCSLFQRDHG